MLIKHSLETGHRIVNCFQKVKENISFFFFFLFFFPTRRIFRHSLFPFHFHEVQPGTIRPQLLQPQPIFYSVNKITGVPSLRPLSNLSLFLPRRPFHTHLHEYEIICLGIASRCAALFSVHRDRCV